MKQVTVVRIASVTLWISLIISFLIIAAFHYFQLKSRGEANTQTDLLLNWMYILCTLAIVASCTFSITRFVRRWREQPSSIVRPLIIGGLLLLMLVVGYMLGSDTPVGSELDRDLPAFWYRLTDMWIYTIYISLGVTLVAVVVGIVGSYLKKSN